MIQRVATLTNLSMFSERLIRVASFIKPPTTYDFETQLKGIVTIHFPFVFAAAFVFPCESCFGAA